ncbi:MAG: succinyl-diaminopimelate desuccinylase [Holosporales bacterium]|jgi:succinyl-diaminopimelate desuccinylase|nr:succinyl-diaminopimelate desuccinylase [Holosporales bacterium]
MQDFSTKILAELVSFETVTPNGSDAIAYCARLLDSWGFSCEMLEFEGVSNLYAKFGDAKKNICFAGHVDVVPPLVGWTTDPFVLTERNGYLYGRGTNDMKGPLSACLAAIYEFSKADHPNFSISVLLTSDEEIMGNNGTKRVVEHLKNTKENITGCVICESCSPGNSGEYIKIGCRGSLNVNLTSNGSQCHVANGPIFGNHITNFLEFLCGLLNVPLDQGSDNFDRTNIEITSIDVDNEVRNIIPSVALAKLNVRFNDCWTFDRLEHHIMQSLPSNVTTSFERFGAPFVGAKKQFISFLSDIITTEIGICPQVGTSGGNSDAVFIKEITDVVEIGTPISGAHITNECISLSDLATLRSIYLVILREFGRYRETGS